MNDMSPSQPSVLDVWYSQKPTLGLMGEFSAGKSTLLNLILDSNVLQTKVTATNMPVIWLTHAEKPKAEALSHDGLLKEFDIDTLNAQGDEGHLVIRLSLPCPILEQIDVIDTPGISDGRLPVGALEFLGPYLDTVIWCSAANQAWRQTEKAMWSSMPERLRSRSVLALTRTDTLRKKTDLQKVIKRCERDARGLFSSVLPISAIVALEAKSEGKDKPEPNKWAASHAPEFFEKIATAIEEGKADCAVRPVLKNPAPVAVELETASAKAQEKPKEDPVTPSEKPAAAAKPKAKSKTKPRSDAKKAKTPDKKQAVAEPKTQVSTLANQLCQLSDTTPHNDQFVNELRHILNSFVGDKDLSEGQRMVVDHAAALDWPDDLPKKKLMAQLIRELNDFALSTWHALDQDH